MTTDVLKRNNVQVTGRGRQPMLFAHGFGCDQTLWRLITPAFEADYRLVLLDYTGSGRSDSTCYDREKYNRLDGYAQDILDVVQALDLKDVVLVGHSVGCMIGLLAANAAPDRFSRLVMVSPSPCYINDGPYKGGFDQAEIDLLLEAINRNLEQWKDDFAPKVIGNTDHPETVEAFRALFCSGDPAIARQFAAVTFRSDNRSDLRKNRIPTLVLQCSDDLLAPVEVGTYVHRQMEGSTLQIMEATGHCPNMTAPDETIRLIQDFLRKS